MKFMGPLTNFWHIDSLIFIYWVLITNSDFILSFVHVLLEYFYGFTFKFYIHIEVKSIILSIFYTMDCRYYLQLAFFTHTILMMFLLIYWHTVLCHVDISLLIFTSLTTSVIEHILKNLTVFQICSYIICLFIPFSIHTFCPFYN